MSDALPRLTIGLPVYNGAAYLSGALDALLVQTMSDFELVVADNASTDATQRICADYAARDLRVRVVRNDRNIGAAGNFNLVRDLARAPLFKWAAYDDLCAPTFVERCVDLLDRDPNLILAYPRTSIIDESGSVIGDYADELDLREASRLARYRAYHLRFRRMGLVNVLYGVVRTVVLRETPGIAPYPNSDIVLIGELALRGPFGEVPEHLFFRRDHPRMTVRAIPSVKNRGEYLDTTNRRASQHPYLRMAREHLRSVLRVPMPWRERLQACLSIARFVVWHAGEFVADRLPGHRSASLGPEPHQAPRLR